MSDHTTPAGAPPGTPETITVTLPAMNFAEEFARAGRAMQAGDLAGQLTPEGFAQWMEQGEAIRAAAGEVVA